MEILRLKKFCYHRSNYGRSTVVDLDGEKKEESYISELNLAKKLRREVLIKMLGRGIDIRTQDSRITTELVEAMTALESAGVMRFSEHAPTLKIHIWAYPE